MALLEIVDLNKSFGALAVINNLYLAVEAGERHAVIGPNGAGKTTLFNLITGWHRPSSGRIAVEGTDLTRLAPQAITFRGLARSFQRNTLFDGLSVLENLRLSVQAQHRARFSLFRDRSAFGEVADEARAVAGQMGLVDVLDRSVSALSYGQKRQLEVGLALCSKPKLLLLDEPAAGTSPAERMRLIDLIADLPRSVTLLLVEHDMDVVFEVCERITVLSYGKLLASGTPDEVRNNLDVRDAYLGKAHARA
ncbi:MAG: ABC transporter ATP-binding protein [Alphaproteobacteria bacterium]|nr:ABC transporter ATP-binding protein [Alphaproteobacteria bacterium]